MTTELRIYYEFQFESLYKTIETIHKTSSITFNIISRYKLLDKKKKTIEYLRPFYVVKIIEFQKEKDDIQKMKKLYHFYKHLKHETQNPNIVNIIDVFVIKTNNCYKLHIIMDYCKYDTINKCTQEFPLENEIYKRSLICDISNGLKYLYNKNIHHYCLSPENIFIDKGGSVFPVAKIGNYGLMDKINGKEEIGISNFDERFEPPEYKQEMIHTKSDVWSFGMIIYYIMIGKTNFEKINMKNEDDCEQQIIFQFNKINDNNCVDLLKKMLVYNPLERIEMKEVFEHPFIVECQQMKQSIKKDLSDYKVIKPLGSGSFGDVVLAE